MRRRATGTAGGPGVAHDAPRRERGGAKPASGQRKRRRRGERGERGAHADRRRAARARARAACTAAGGGACVGRAEPRAPYRRDAKRRHRAAGVCAPRHLARSAQAHRQWLDELVGSPLGSHPAGSERRHRSGCRRR
eukprot:2610995-Prymnesium_polylepis.1